ncbi:MAG: MATE family efflux transporter [Lachnospiraceae bacterium]|nr:MATE family efflux transporter [Lachnospiraceae bacterium]
MPQQNDFSKGNIPRTVTRLAIPMIAAMLVNALYSVVDRIYIGHLEDVGQLALTGIGLCYPITMSVTAFSYLVGNGGGPLTSILRGAGDDEGAEKILGNSITLLVALGIIVPAVCLLIKEPILYLFGASDATYPYANAYITIYLLGSISVMLTLGLNPFLNAQGFTRIGMMTVLIGAVCNIVLDPVFIFVFDMGVSGAAIATVISQTVSAVWVILFLLGKKNLIRVRVKNLKPEVKTIRRITSLGFSSFVMSITEAAVSAVFNASLSQFGGDIYVTVMTVATSVSQVVHMPMNGFAQGAQPVTGYNYGAGQYGRVKESFRFLTKFCVTYAVVAWALLMLFPAQIISIFNNDAQLIATAVPMFRIFFCMNFIMSLQMAAQNTFVAMEESRKATFFALYRKVILLIPLTLILPRIGFGVAGVFAAEPVADTISAVTCFTVFMLTAYKKLGKLERAQH